jgi:hypothetical protein
MPRVRQASDEECAVARLASCRGALLVVVFLVREETLDRLTKYET